MPSRPSERAKPGQFWPLRSNTHVALRCRTPRGGTITLVSDRFPHTSKGLLMLAAFASLYGAPLETSLERKTFSRTWA